jgi:hypothetical protein
MSRPDVGCDLGCEPIYVGCAYKMIISLVAQNFFTEKFFKNIVIKQHIMRRSTIAIYVAAAKNRKKTEKFRLPAAQPKSSFR